jgi:hypothetical protein
LATAALVKFIDEHTGHRVGDGLRLGVESICAVLSANGAAIAPSTYYDTRARAPVTSAIGSSPSASGGGDAPGGGCRDAGCGPGDDASRAWSYRDEHHAVDVASRNRRTSGPLDILGQAPMVVVETIPAALEPHTTAEESMKYVLLDVASDLEAQRLIEDVTEHPGSPLRTPRWGNAVHATLTAQPAPRNETPVGA